MEIRRDQVLNEYADVIFLQLSRIARVVSEQLVLRVVDVHPSTLVDLVARPDLCRCPTMGRWRRWGERSEAATRMSACWGGFLQGDVVSG